MIWKLLGWSRRVKYNRTLWYNCESADLQPWLQWLDAAQPDEKPMQLWFRGYVPLSEHY